MPRINSQLFWVDPRTANSEREKNPVFKAMDVKENVLKPLDAMLRRDHVLAKVYKTAREKYDEARFFAPGGFQGCRIRIRKKFSNSACARGFAHDAHNDYNLPQISHFEQIFCIYINLWVQNPNQQKFFIMRRCARICESGA